jgi:hypothetical protein
MSSITFEEPSKLKRIGGRDFSGWKLNSITIPASTEEINGSAFLDCPKIDIRVANNMSPLTQQKGQVGIQRSEEILALKRVNQPNSFWSHTLCRG